MIIHQAAQTQHTLATRIAQVIMKHGQLIPLHGGNPIPLTKPVLTIGRSPDCDIVVRHKSIASQHCQLKWRQGSWFVLDLGSKNGVRVDGQPCTDQQVSPGSVIRVGAARFELSMPSDKMGTTSSDQREAATTKRRDVNAATTQKRPGIQVAGKVRKEEASPTQEPAVRPGSNRPTAPPVKPAARRFLGKLTPEAGGDIFPLMDDRIVIGRGRSCELRLKFATVSTEHCCLEFRDGYWLARDLDSRNGIRVNGETTRESWLMPGDTLSVAKFRFEIEYQPRSEEPPPPLDPMAGGSLLEKAGLTKALEKDADPDWLKSDQDPEPDNRIDLESL